MNRKRYDLIRLRDQTGQWLDAKRQVHPPQRQQHPTADSDEPGTSQRGGSGMGGSERRSGSLSDPETLTQNQTYSVASDGDPSEEKEMFQKLLERIVNLE